MYQLSLNVGLVSAHDGSELGLSDVRSIVLTEFPEAKKAGAVFEDAQSSTERTLVLSLFSVDDISLVDIHRRLYNLSIHLEQDCIAWTYGAHGQLSGPKAVDWGSFDPDFFIRPSVCLTGQ